MIERNEKRVVVIARFTAKPGKEQELLQNLHSLMAPTHKEPGCIRYELNQDVADSRIFTFVEKFDSQEAFDSHKKMPHITHHFQDTAPGLVEASSISVHREILPYS